MKTKADESVHLSTGSDSSRQGRVSEGIDASVNFDTRKAKASKWFFSLRDRLCSAVQEIEHEYRDRSGRSHRTAEFQVRTTKRQTHSAHDGGGGSMSVLRNGNVFEKVGVNASTVFGELEPGMRDTISSRKNLPGMANDARFWASGVSLVAHPQNPKVPAVHLNTRMFWTPFGYWFGGGTDLNPCLENQGDARFFHNQLRAVCDRHQAGYYQRFSAWAEKYFFVTHRGRPRGVGGIFYDDLSSGDWKRDFAFSRDVGRTFFEAYVPIVKRRCDEKWTVDEREAQLLHRGLYVEFNLILDRGTRFGLASGHDADAVLMSLPPLAKWQ